MPTTIIDYSKEIINFLDNVNYGMSKPQFNHLATIIEGNINVEGKISISKIAENIAKAKDQSCICRFLSDSPWDDKLLNHNRLGYLQHIMNRDLLSEDIGFLVIDDTVNLKDLRTKSMEGLDFHYSHVKGKACWSHCIVNSHFVAGSYSVPIEFKPYYREGKCSELSVSFQSKTDIAEELIQTFEKPSELENVYVLVDSWYTSINLISQTLLQGYHLIGGMKRNRIFFPNGIRTKISDFVEDLDPTTLDSVTVKDKEYKVFRYEGKIVKSDKIVLLISYEVKKDGFEKPVCIVCTDTSLDTKTVLDYYSVRWTIETSYQYLKENLGFDQYRVRSLLSIERYISICFLVYTFLEIFRISKGKLSLKTIGEVIRYHKNVTAKKFIKYICYQAKQNIPLESLYGKRTIKDVLYNYRDICMISL